MGLHTCAQLEGLTLALLPQEATLLYTLVSPSHWEGHPTQARDWNSAEPTAWEFGGGRMYLKSQAMGSAVLNSGLITL